jgi:response regulator of citrate/malate metabolism
MPKNSSQQSRNQEAYPMYNETLRSILAAMQRPEPPRSKAAEEAGAALNYSTGTIEQYLKAKQRPVQID